MRDHRSAKSLWSRPLGDLVRPIIDPVLARRGFGPTGLVLYWEEIVGERLAAYSRPERVQWPPRHRGFAGEAERDLAALIVRVETGFALELQHLAPVVIERVNAHFGWRCISRLVLRQGPVPARPAPRPPRIQPSAAGARAAEAKLAGSGFAEPLRQALLRLGTHILAGS